MREVTFDLPSKGYLDVSQVARVTMREYLVEEEKGLFSSKKPFQKLLDLVSSTVVWAADAVGQEIDPSAVKVTNYPYADFLHSLCRLRAVSDQETYQFVLPCPNCKGSVPFEVELTPDGLDTTYLREEETSVEYTSDETSFGKITCRHVLVKNHLTLENLISKRKAKAGRNWDNGFTLRIANQLVALDGEPFGSIVNAEAWLNKLAKRQRVELTAIFNQFAFGDDLSLALECDSCGHVDTVMMPISDKDFLFREPDNSGKRRRS